MKKYLIASLIFATSFFATACGDSEYGYVLMEFEHQDATYEYLGTDGGKDYDAKCIEDHGPGYLSFIPSYSPNEYTCLRTCKTRGTTEGDCSTANNIYYGLTDITAILKCEEFDGKLVFVTSELQHCKHACTADFKACD